MPNERRSYLPKTYVLPSFILVYAIRPAHLSVWYFPVQWTSCQNIIGDKKFERTCRLLYSVKAQAIKRNPLNSLTFCCGWYGRYIENKIFQRFIDWIQCYIFYIYIYTDALYSNSKKKTYKKNVSFVLAI